MYLTLSKNVALKSSKKEKILLNLITGEKYELDEEQYDFILQCDGNSTIEDFVSEYDQESKKVVLKFIDRLKRMGAINLGESSPRVIYTNVVPELRLQLVHLEATSCCNMKCVHCYQGEMYPAKDNLNIGEVISLIRTMQIMQVDSLSISGGEPFIDSKTFEIVNCAEEHDIRISSFFTNGVLLNEQMIARIVAMKSKPTLYVSVDSITSEGMSFRGLNCSKEAEKIIDKIVENIKILVDSDVRVVVNTVINSHNIDDLKRMHERMKKLCVKSWRVGYPKNTGFLINNQEFVVDFDKMIQASFDLLQYHLTEGQPFDLQIEYLYRRELIENLEKVDDEDFVCDYETKRESCCIKPNGDVVVCAYCNHMPLGNIRKQSLWDIWYSDAMQSIKNTRVKDVGECVGCELRSLCAAGCRANAYFLNGDFKNGKDDYACKAVGFFKNNVIPLLVNQKNSETTNLIPDDY
ncbi:MAG: radical SAM protein [Nanoarchaeota archaeon]|nr:radical SAM protein [Nanoarchaeota archaeon]